MQYTRLWIALVLVIVGSFAVLGGVGVRAVTQVPPIPQQVISADGKVLFDRSTIQRGQGVWQSLGGQQIGSIWGHGAYIAPDWTADWLHREAVTRLDRWARDTGTVDFAALSGEQQAALQIRLQGEMRTNTYDPATGPLRISAVRAETFEVLARYYAEVFAQDREAYAIPRSLAWLRAHPLSACDRQIFLRGRCAVRSAGRMSYTSGSRAFSKSSRPS